MKRRSFLACCGVALVGWTAAAEDSTADLPGEAAAAMRRAVAFYHGQVASHGGYVYRYSADLARREGEGKTGLDTVWVQPPGTPSVGLAYTEAWLRTREPYLLEAARDAATCLIRGQLESGGWTDRIEFAADARVRFAYRVDAKHGKRPFNVTTFDDNKSQSAIRMLVRLDEALRFEDRVVHEAAQFALNSVLQAQFPNGAWPQGYREFPDPKKYPVRRASYPETWSRTYPGGDYWDFYTFNDNALADTIDVLLLAAHVYREPRYRTAAFRAGDFILLAQMPDPQPAWAQQYNFDMHPAWARKFEPPAISGGESQGVLRILMRLYEESGDEKYLEPIPRAIAYLKKSEIAPEQLARFYELRTNRPLYFTRAYQLTDDDSDLPTHYGFKIGHKLSELSAHCEEIRRLSAGQRETRRTARYRLSRGRPSEKQVRALIDSLDARGAWVESGKLSYHGKDDPTRQIIDSATFAKNLDVLSRFVGGEAE